MIEENARELVCPFMSDSKTVVTCITTECMAWWITKDYSEVTYKELPPEECEGYCMRLNQEN
jgi:hypothetical protein